MSDAVVMAFVGDLFPRQIAAPEAVAKGIAQYCGQTDYSNAEVEIRDVVRAAGEWQETLKPARKLFKAPAPPATEADFLAAAKRAYDRWGA